MRSSRLSKYQKNWLIELFVAITTAGAITVSINRGGYTQGRVYLQRHGTANP